MKLAICLQSCGRHDLTTQTLESFHRYNGQRLTAPFDTFRIAAEDGGVDPQNIKLAKSYGFVDVSPSKRLGNTRCRHHLIHRASKMGATHVLLWENDWESIREVPWDAVNYCFAHSDIYHMRLWHEWKIPRKYHAWVEAGRPKYISRHRGRNGADPGWKLLTGAPEPIEVGSIHWSAPPAITRIDEALWLHQAVRAESGSIKKSGELDLHVARVMENVVWHIGEARRTEEFRR